LSVYIAHRRKKNASNALSVPSTVKNKKYILLNSESVQCNFVIFDLLTFIQFKICCCLQNFIERLFFGWDTAI